MPASMKQLRLWWWERMHETPLAMRALCESKGIQEPAWITEALARRPRV